MNIVPFTAPTTEPGTALDYALKYAALGWYVFPVWGAHEGRCRCGGFCKSPGKHPVGHLVPRGQDDATRDPAIIRRWWTQMPEAGIAIRLDSSGLVVIDIDPRNGGLITMEAIECQHGHLVSDVLAFTQGGGEHRVFALRAEVLISLPGKLGDGVDVKRHGYIVVEPTVGPLGEYAWDAESDPLHGAIPSPLPDWLRDLAAMPSMVNTVDLPSSRFVTPAQLDELRAALATLQADDYHTWINYGQALWPLGQAGFDLWDTWSRTSEKYHPVESIKKWRSFKPGPYNFESIFHDAQQAGWINPLSVNGAPVFAPEPERAAELLNKIRVAPVVVVPAANEAGLRPLPIRELEEASAWISGLYEAPTPAITQAGVLALASIAAGRGYRSTAANWPSILLVLSGPSGVGKNYIKVGIERLLIYAGLERLIAGDFYTHQSAIYWALRQQPAHICISDEFGENFSEARKNNNANKLTVFKALKKVYSDADHIFKTESYAMGGLSATQREAAEMRPVINPALTLVGLTTPFQFFSEIKTAHIESGLINRLIIVTAENGQQVPGQQTSDAPPATLIEAVQRVRQQDVALRHTAYDQKPNPVVVRIDRGAAEVFTAIKERQEQACLALEEEHLDAMPRRWRENAMRLATALAPWRDHECPVIDGELAAWTCDYVTYWGHRAIAALRATSGENDYQQVVNKVLLHIQQAPNGVTDTDLSRVFKSVKRREMTEIKSHLAEAELIVQVKGESTAKGGRPSLRWFAVREG